MSDAPIRRTQVETPVSGERQGPCDLRLAVLLMLTIAPACGDPLVQTTYDDLNDVTRVRIAPINEETPLQLEAYFACAGPSMCKPDSVSLELNYVAARAEPHLCPQTQWTGVFENQDGELSFGCEITSAELVIDSVGPPVRADVLYFGEHVPGGWQGPDLDFERVTFALAYEDLRRIAGGEVDPWFLMGDARLRLVGQRYYLGLLVAEIEEEAVPGAITWDVSVNADYRAEENVTHVQALLPVVPDSVSGGIALTTVEGQCPGRGWCGQPTLSMYFEVRDPTYYSLSLTDMEFILADSTRLAPRFVQVTRLGRWGIIEVEVDQDLLRDIAGSSRVRYRVDTVDTILPEDQMKVLREFAQRIDDAQRTASRDPR